MHSGRPRLPPFLPPILDGQQRPFRRPLYSYQSVTGRPIGTTYKKETTAMVFHRRIIVALIAALGLMAFAAPGSATHLAPFIDLQEAGLSVVEDGEGLMFWDHTTPATLNANVGGT